MNVLISGARAPIALELARQFSALGHNVVVTDSVKLPIARSCRFIKSYFQHPPPRFDSLGFVRALKQVIELHQIDILVPTCEEAFFVSRYRDRFTCEVFVAPFELMRAIHSKRTFLALAADCDINVPNTRAITTTDARDESARQASASVFKREFSRFASETLICPNALQIQSLEIDESNPWLAQEFISGRELCSYTVVREGEVVAHALYHPKHRVGLGSGVYFEPMTDDRVLNFVQKFARKTNYTGQIGFDFIDGRNGLYVLECNPRGTSGAHLFADAKNGILAAAILGQTRQLPPMLSECRMVAPAMLLFNFGHRIRHGSVFSSMIDYLRAKDVVYSSTDRLPFFFQFVAIGEIVWRSLWGRKRLTEAATADIEWNGEELA